MNSIDGELPPKTPFQGINAPGREPLTAWQIAERVEQRALQRVSSEQQQIAALTATVEQLSERITALENTPRFQLNLAKRFTNFLNQSPRYVVGGTFGMGTGLMLSVPLELLTGHAAVVGAEQPEVAFMRVVTVASSIVLGGLAAHFAVKDIAQSSQSMRLRKLMGG